MERLARGIVQKRKGIIICFLMITVLAVLLIPFVRVNYNIADYLPPKAGSTAGIKLMQEEFTQTIPNANVMARDVSLREALVIKEQLSRVEGVSEVLWLDDVVDLKQPLAMLEPETVEGFYKNGQALFLVSVDKGAEPTACAAFWEIIGPRGAVSGEAANLTDMQESAVEEVGLAVAILLPAIIIILLLSTTSWLEPILFLSAIGVSVLINMGTNLVFGEVSFITNAISPILQLAVSMDYAIFLLHSFADFRTKKDDIEEAMAAAIQASMTTIAASATTTLFGFLALVFMDFRIGADLGICLAKGIILSFVSVMVFLPALTLTLHRYLEKTRHRAWWPDFKGLSKGLTKLFVPFVVVVALLIVPSFLGQRQTSFIYGNSTDLDRRIGYSSWLINEEFGGTNILAFLVPRGEPARENELAHKLAEKSVVKNVVAYATSVDPVIPVDFLGEEISSQFYSENYARFIVYTDLPSEGEFTFQQVEEINSLVSDYYEQFYLVGQSATLWDMKKAVTVDNVRVNLIAIIAIFLVVAFSFRSFTLPVILLLTIEVAIWLNLSFPYFAGISISFIGYLVLSTIQLGATIDYAILLTDTYLKKRKILSGKEAITVALASAFQSILISASILSIAGFTLYFTSSNSIVQDIGILLGRGTLISMLLVICFLPALLILRDKIKKRSVAS